MSQMVVFVTNSVTSPQNSVVASKNLLSQTTLKPKLERNTIHLKIEKIPTDLERHSESVGIFYTDNTKIISYK